jgi:2-dehydropantoate 2-reductase
MNIVVFGAGAIGSLFGGLLSQRHHVALVGRKPHVAAIQRHGLCIQGKTRMNVTIPAVESVEQIHFEPEVVILTVKAYDTKTAIEQVKGLLTEQNLVLSLQNGLGNLEEIEKVVKKTQILAGVTTHGVLFNRPGVITHTGKGKTILGALSHKTETKAHILVGMFNEVAIATSLSSHIQKDLWMKSIINSSINSLTAIFGRPNGYLLQNLLLTRFVEMICAESTAIAQGCGIEVTFQQMLTATKEVITQTADNYSSMYQSLQKGQRTEVDSISGYLVHCGQQQGCETVLNATIVQLLHELTRENTVSL